MCFSLVLCQTSTWVTPGLTGDFANGELPYFSKSKSLGQGLSTLTYLFSSSYIRSRFQHSSCRINSTAALRGTFILELMPGSM